MRPRKFVRSTALVLVLTAALTVTAFAADPTQQPATKTDNKSSYYPTSVEMTEDDAGNPMIRKTYQLSVSDDPQKLPVADFERDGRRYYLLDMTKEDKIGVDTKEHSETVKLSSDTKEMEQILQRLDAQKEVTTEDGHTGVLTLDHTSVKVPKASQVQRLSRTLCPLPLPVGQDRAAAVSTSHDTPSSPRGHALRTVSGTVCLPAGK